MSPVWFRRVTRFALAMTVPDKVDALARLLPAGLGVTVAVNVPSSLMRRVSVASSSYNDAETQLRVPVQVYEVTVGGVRRLNLTGEKPRPTQHSQRRVSAPRW